jgi:hypothetical protein
MEQNNIFMQHKDEIKSIGEMNGVDWNTAVLMWQNVHPELVKAETQEQKDALEAQRKAFFKAVDGVQGNE